MELNTCVQMGESSDLGGICFPCALELAQVSFIFVPNCDPIGMPMDRMGAFAKQCALFLLLR
jgi:hypothetical protein